MQTQENVNPCLACGLDQNCCNGLKISKSEYENLFKRFTSLNVMEYKGLFTISTNDGSPCPYWNPDGCTIYEKRPIDCRVFPYNLHKLVNGQKKIKAILYGETHCPIKEEIYLPIQEAKALVTNLARQVYGSQKPVEIQFVFGRNPPRTFGVFDPVISRISSWLRKH